MSSNPRRDPRFGQAVVASRPDSQRFHLHLHLHQRPTYQLNMQRFFLEQGDVSCVALFHCSLFSQLSDFDMREHAPQGCNRAGERWMRKNDRENTSQMKNGSSGQPNALLSGDSSDERERRVEGALVGRTNTIANRRTTGAYSLIVNVPHSFHLVTTLSDISRCVLLQSLVNAPASRQAQGLRATLPATRKMDHQAPRCLVRGSLSQP